MRLVSNVDLAAEKSKAKAKVDEIAERIRGYFVTPGSGQAMVYTEKRKEAEDYLANLNIGVGEIPHIALEAALDGVTIFDKSVEVVTVSYQWREISSRIERIRLETKKNIDLATDYRVIREMPNNMDWSPVLMFVQQ